MSQYSGKCDLYDACEKFDIKNPNFDFSKIKIFKAPNKFDDLANEKVVVSALGTKEISIQINSLKDLVPYYPFVCGILAADKTSVTAHISSYSYVLERTHEILISQFNILRKYYISCKRKDIVVTNDMAIEYLKKYYAIDDNSYALVSRFLEHPYSKNVDGLFLKYGKSKNNLLYQEMLQHGYTEEQAYQWVTFNKKTWYSLNPQVNLWGCSQPQVSSLSDNLSD